MNRTKETTGKNESDCQFFYRNGRGLNFFSNVKIKCLNFNCF